MPKPVSRGQTSPEPVAREAVRGPGKKQALADRARIEPRDRAELRDWLQSNHAKSGGVWLVYDKKARSEQSADAGRLTYDHAVEELLCFGWIDSVARGLNDRRTMMYICARKPGSAWSTLNKRRVEKLVDLERITAAGLAKIEAAKKDGSWAIYDQLDAPGPDLRRALKKSRKAFRAFEALPPGRRRQLLLPIVTSKSAKTRESRIARLIELLESTGARG